MYKPNSQSEFRVKCDFRVDFTNGGYVEGHDFLLDLERNTVSDEDLKVMIIESLNLAKAGEVQIFKKKIVRRGEHQDAQINKRSTTQCSVLFHLRAYQRTITASTEPFVLELVVTKTNLRVCGPGDN